MNLDGKTQEGLDKEKKVGGFPSMDKDKARKIQSKGGYARWEKYHAEKKELEKLRKRNDKV